MATRMIDIGLVGVTGGEEVAILAGDFGLVESTAWHQQEIILNNKGEYKENPTIGVGAFEYMDGESLGDLVREIAVQFAQDGMNVKGVSISEAGVVESDAYYP